jgi:subtilisin-like proprotein convertase family protein
MGIVGASRSSVTVGAVTLSSGAIQLPIVSAPAGSIIVATVYLAGGTFLSAPGWSTFASVNAGTNWNNNPATGGGPTGGGFVTMVLLTKAAVTADFSPGVTYSLGTYTTSGGTMGYAWGHAEAFQNVGGMSLHDGLDEITSPVDGEYAIRVWATGGSDIGDFDWQDNEPAAPVPYGSSDPGTDYYAPSTPVGSPLLSGRTIFTVITISHPRYLGGTLVPHWIGRTDMTEEMQLDANGVTGPLSVLSATFAHGGIDHWWALLVYGPGETDTLDSEFTPTCAERLSEAPALDTPGMDQDASDFIEDVAISANLGPIADVGNVTNIQVGLKITHPAIGWVGVALESPSGRRVPVFLGNSQQDHDLGDGSHIAWFHSDDSGGALDDFDDSNFDGTWGPLWGNFFGPVYFQSGAESFFYEGGPSGRSHLEYLLGESVTGTWKLWAWDTDADNFEGTVDLVILRICLDDDTVLMMVV